MVKRITTDSELIRLVSESTSMYDLLRRLGLKLAGGSCSHYKKRINSLGLSTDHWVKQSWNKGKISPARLKSSEILILRTEGIRQKSYKLVRAMLESGVKHECSKCGCPPNWQGNPLTLDVDHVNENWLDDRLENLRFLCPNCHSQFSRKLLGK